MKDKVMSYTLKVWLTTIVAGSILYVFFDAVYNLQYVSRYQEILAALLELLGIPFIALVAFVCSSPSALIFFLVNLVLIKIKASTLFKRVVLSPFVTMLIGIPYWIIYDYKINGVHMVGLLLFELTGLALLWMRKLPQMAEEVNTLNL